MRERVQYFSRNKMSTLVPSPSLARASIFELKSKWRIRISIIFFLKKKIKIVFKQPNSLGKGFSSTLTSTQEHQYENENEDEYYKVYFFNSSYGLI